MEEQIDILKTRRMSWDAVSRILEKSVHELLGKKIRIRAWAEDTDYWGAIAQDYRFSLDDLNRLMDSVQANSTVRLRTLPEDDTTTNSFGMDLGELLLKRKLQANWSDWHIAKPCLWLLGYTSCQTHPYTATGLLNSLPKDKLMNTEDVKDYLYRNGCSDRALSEIREAYLEEFGNELCWRYPISDEKHLGAFILVVQEGFLHIPYDCVYYEPYELLEMDDIALHNAESLELFLADWINFSDDLVDALNAMRDKMSPQL